MADQIPIPKNLIDEIRAGQCVIFVGAGLSIGAGLDSWYGLLIKLLAYLKVNHVGDEALYQTIEQLIDDGNLIEAAEQIRTQLTNYDFAQFMRDLFDGLDPTQPRDEQEPQPIQPQQTHKLIAQLPFYAALTTNYDRLIEQAHGDRHPISHDEATQIVRLYRSDDFYVLKCHGDIERIETIVLTKADYDKIINRNEAYKDHIKYLFLAKTILFIGFSLNDPDINLFLDELNSTYKGYNPSHYALMYQAHEQREFYKERNINIIPYDQHDQVESFLSDLVSAVPKMSDDESQITWDRSPFPGLRAFTEADEPIFFGHELETLELLDKVKSHAFVVVIGASGSGKSSLVGAGLIPKMRQEIEQLYVVRFTPGDNPFKNLINSDGPKNLPRLDLFELMNSQDTILAQLEASIEAHDDAQILLFIDQFEELFTLTPDYLQEPFIDMLKQPTSKVKIVITMRADFYQEATKYLERELTHANLTVSQPSTFVLRDMIAKPAHLAGIRFEAGLVERIVEDTGDEPGNLALMAYVLDELHSLDEDALITHEEYESLGGVKGAIGTRAENIWQGLDLDEAVLRQAFARLIEVDERGTATRRRAEIEPDDSDVHKLIEAFADSRLLITDYDEERETATVEIAHEAILREWHTLRDWTDERQADFLIVARMRRDAEWWHQNGRRELDLPRAERVDEFWEACRNLGLTIDERSEPLLIEFAEDERERLIKLLAIESIDQETYDYVMYRLNQIGGDLEEAGIATLLNPNAFAPLRREIAEALGKLGGSRAVDLLIRLLTDKEQLGATYLVGTIAEALGNIGDNRAVEPLIASLENTDQGNYQIVKALGKLQDNRAIRPLLLAMNTFTTNIENQPEVEPLTQMLGKKIVDLLITILDHSKPFFNERRLATIKLIQLQDPRKVEPLIFLLLNLDERVRKIVSTALGKQAVEPLLEILKSKSDFVRKQSAIALGELRDERAVKPLIQMLEDEQDYVRCGVSTALGNLGDERAVEPLIQLLEDEDNSEQSSATTPIRIAKPPDYKNEVRRIVATALGNLGDERAVEPLIQLLEDEDISLRNKVAIALIKLKKNPLLIDRLYKGDVKVRRSIAEAFARQLEPAVSGSLLSKFDDEDDIVRANIASALGKVSDLSSVDPLMSLLNDESSFVRNRAVIALGRLGDARAMSALVPLLNDPDKYVIASTLVAMQSLSTEPLTDIVDFWNRKVFELLIGQLGRNDLGNSDDDRIIATLRMMKHHMAQKAVEKWDAEHSDEPEI